MKIDNRFLIPVVAPFALFSFIRVFCWFAGMSFNADGVGVISLFVGISLGSFATTVLFFEKISIGHITIGRRQ